MCSHIIASKPATRHYCTTQHDINQVSGRLGKDISSYQQSAGNSENAPWVPEIALELITDGYMFFKMTVFQTVLTDFIVVLARGDSSWLGKLPGSIEVFILTYT